MASGSDPSLADWLAQHGRMPPEQFVPFFAHVCEVVHAAHERGIVHRDLKPSNLMVVECGDRLTPKLLDLGIARGSWRRRSELVLDAGADADVGATLATPTGATTSIAPMRNPTRTATVTRTRSVRRRTACRFALAAPGGGAAATTRRPGAG